MRVPASAAPRLVGHALLAAALSFLSPAVHPAAADAPSAESQLTLRRAFTFAQSGLDNQADKLLSESIAEWEKTHQPADEVAALYKTRGMVRADLGDQRGAMADLDVAIRLGRVAGSSADPTELSRAYRLRARAHNALGQWREEEADLSAAIAALDDLPALEATNPFLYSQRGAARSKLTNFRGAADDHMQAQADYRSIGDKIRRTISGADLALSLYGAGDEVAAVEQMRATFKSKGFPTTNNPDDIALLQELSRKDAELHLVYAAHLNHIDLPLDAARQWESGCIRLEAYVQDGLARLDAEAELSAREAESAEADGKETSLRAPSVANQPFNSGFNARLNGLDPNSPYVTQRAGRAYFWYKEGEGSVERRDAGNALATIDPRLSCASFREPAWLRAQRPEWPPVLAARVKEYADAAPQQPIVMPSKGGPPSDGEINF